VPAGGLAGRSLWKRGDVCLLGCGAEIVVALRGAWATGGNARFVVDLLNLIEQDGRPSLAGTGPLAIGALPYDPCSPASLVVPRLVVGALGERWWATLLGPAERGLTAADVRRAVEEELAHGQQGTTGGTDAAPDAFELEASMPHEEWKRVVQSAIAEMEKGAFSKVVLARRVEVRANRPFVLPDVLARLNALYPSCTVFRVDGFLGASPETLVRKRGHEVLSNPLAGTVARSGDEATDAALLGALLTSKKERWEHQLVVDAIAERLRPFCSYLDVPDEPAVMALRNVSHLSTLMRGALREDAAWLAGEQARSQERPQPRAGRSAEQDNGHNGDGSEDLVSPAAPSLPSSLELAALLQPTPAVGGHPTAAALEWQREHEGFDRGCYAGPVGWVDASGDGEWAVGVRSANVEGRSAALYAGNGIVVGSLPDAELAETQLKLQALLAALVRP